MWIHTIDHSQLEFEVFVVVREYSHFQIRNICHFHLVGQVQAHREPVVSLAL